MMNMNHGNLKIIKLGNALLICLAAWVLTGCEDVVKVDLDNVEPRLVIEAYITDNPPLAVAIITKSADFYDLSTFSLVSGATVIIYDDLGAADTIPEYEHGVYVSQSVFAHVGLTYTAEVTVDSVTYTAQASLPPPIDIDSLVTQYQPGGGFGYEADEGYRLHVFFTDHPAIEDFCYLKVQVNDSLLDDYYLYDGKYSDGHIIDYERFGDVFELGDTMTVAIYTMDQAVYDYFSTLVNVIAYSGSGEQQYGGVPANPNTNWDNGALGYFAVFGVRTATLVITE